MNDIIYIPLGAAAFGGAERSLCELAAAMQAEGKDVLVLSERSLQGTAFEGELAANNLRVVWVEWRPEAGWWKNIKSAYQVFRLHRSSIIHINISWRGKMWLIPLLARSISTAKLVGTMRAMPDPAILVPRKRYFEIIPSLRLWRLRDMLVGWLHSRCLHRTVCINANDFPVRLVNDYLYDPNRIRVIYNGIAVRLESPSLEERVVARNELGHTSSEIVVCYIGRLAYGKGVQDLIHAISELPSPYKLIVVGEGPYQDELRVLCRTLGLDRQIRFAGYHENIDIFLLGADIVVIPSLRYEAFGRVVVEAMNYGLPIVASRVGGMAELFTHGQEGFYTQPGSPNELSEAITKLGENATMRGRMGAAGRRLIKERYNVNRLIDEYVKLYHDLSMGE